MPLSLYAGNPKSGKTYTVMDNAVIPALKAGRRIVTNIPLVMERVNAWYPDANVRIFATDEAAKPGFFDSVEAGALFVFDESWNLWPSGMKAKDVPDEHKQFLRMHGHRVGENGLTIEIVLLSQEVGDVCAFVRSIVDVTYRMEKLDIIGADKRYRCDVYRRAPTGSRPPQRDFIRSLYGKYSPDVYELYKAHSQSVTGAAGQEKRSDERASVWRRPIVRYGLPLALVLMISGLVGTVNFFRHFGSHFNAKDAKAIKTVTPLQSMQALRNGYMHTHVAAMYGGPSAALQVSRNWRLGGVVWGADGKGQAVLTSPMGNRTIPVKGHCHREPGSPDWVCMVDGEKVTQWSGYFGGSNVDAGGPGQTVVPVLSLHPATGTRPQTRPVHTVPGVAS